MPESASSSTRFVSPHFSTISPANPHPQGNSKYGENLSAGYGDATSSIKAWGDERSKYDFNNPSFSGETGHFTQMVWKSTSKVGCAAVKCNNIIGSGQQWFVVCNYSAPGNYIGEFPKNVLRQTNGGGKGSQSPSYGDNSDGEDRTPSKGNGGRSNYGNDTDTEDDSYDDGNNTDTEDEDDTPSYSHGKPSRKNQKNQPWYPYHGKNSGHRKQIDYKPYRPHRPRHPKADNRPNLRVHSGHY